MTKQSKKLHSLTAQNYGCKVKARKCERTGWFRLVLEYQGSDGATQSSHDRYGIDDVNLYRTRNCSNHLLLWGRCSLTNWRWLNWQYTICNPHRVKPLL